MLWEMIRVGNDHLGGHRLATFERPREQHAIVLLVLGFLLFWLVDLLAAKQPHEPTEAQVLPRGLLLHSIREVI
jgi:hypothetical protein